MDPKQASDSIEAWVTASAEREVFREQVAQDWARIVREAGFLPPDAVVRITGTFVDPAPLPDERPAGYYSIEELKRLLED